MTKCTHCQAENFKNNLTCYNCGRIISENYGFQLDEQADYMFFNRRFSNIFKWVTLIIVIFYLLLGIYIGLNLGWLWFLATVGGGFDLAIIPYAVYAHLKLQEDRKGIDGDIYIALRDIRTYLQQSKEND